MGISRGSPGTCSLPSSFAHSSNCAKHNANPSLWGDLSMVIKQRQRHSPQVSPVQAWFCGQVRAQLGAADCCVSLKAGISPSTAAKHLCSTPGTFETNTGMGQGQCLSLRSWHGNREIKAWKVVTFSFLCPLSWIKPVQFDFAPGLCGILVIKHK